jgi:hypothetical protein
MKSQPYLGDPELHCYNSNTADLEAVCDNSSVVQPSIPRGITVPDSQQPVPQTLIVSEVQEQVTLKFMHQHRRLPAAYAPTEVISSSPTDESWSSMSKLQSGVRFLLCLRNPGIHICYLLVVSRATMYKIGITIPESKITTTTSNHSIGSTGRKHLGVHILEENHSWTIVNKCTSEEIS